MIEGEKKRLRAATKIGKKIAPANKVLVMDRESMRRFVKEGKAWWATRHGMIIPNAYDEEEE